MIKWWKEKMVTRQGYGLGIGGYKRLCPAATGHSFVTLLSLPVSVKDRSLHKSSRQVTYLLSQAHTYVWALGRLVTLLSWVSALSGLTVMVAFGLGGPCTALSPGLRDGGLESQFRWGPGPRDRRVVGWSCLCLGISGACVFWLPSWGH